MEIITPKQIVITLALASVILSQTAGVNAGTLEKSIPYTGGSATFKDALVANGRFYKCQVANHKTGTRYEWTKPGIGIVDEGGESTDSYLIWKSPISDESLNIQIKVKIYPPGEEPGGNPYEGDWKAEMVKPVIDTYLGEIGQPEGEVCLAKGSGGSASVFALVEKAPGGGSFSLDVSGETKFEKEGANIGALGFTTEPLSADCTYLNSFSLTGNEEAGDSLQVKGTVLNEMSQSLDSDTSGDIIVFDVEIQNEGQRDSDDIQIQHLKKSGGNFSLYAIPAKIYYKIVTGQGCSPDSVTLKVKLGATVIRSQSLGTSTGEQDATWNGKNDSGDYVDYGNYTIQINVTKDDAVAVANHSITVYEVRLGNCVYRDKSWNPFIKHAGVLYRYVGTENKLDDLSDDTKYKVLQHPGNGTITTCTLSAFKSAGTWRGTYCPSGLTKSRRESILEKGYALDVAGIEFIAPPWLDVLKPDGDWGGTISDIDRIRCDGVPEVAYEDAGERLYGGDWWNIMLNQSNLDKHNDGGDSITPSKQRSHATLSTNSADSLYKP